MLSIFYILTTAGAYIRIRELAPEENIIVCFITALVWPVMLGALIVSTKIEDDES